MVRSPFPLPFQTNQGGGGGVGIAIYPPTGEDGIISKESLGNSSTAGKYAIGQTAASRVFTNMFVPSPSPLLNDV